MVTTWSPLFDVWNIEDEKTDGAESAVLCGTYFVFTQNYILVLPFKILNSKDVWQHAKEKQVRKYHI